jgi:hypothetical protein
VLVAGAMLRPLVLTALASLGVAALGASLGACSGSIEQGAQPAPSSSAPADSGPPPASDAGVTPPPREVTAPIVIDLGDVAYGQDVTLDVPAGALGFNVIVESKSGAAAEDLVGIERITSPSGEIVHDAYTPKGGNHATSEAGFGALASVSVPQSEAKSANPPEAGKWILRIGGGGAQPPPPALDAGGGGLDAGPPAATLHAEARIQLGSSAGFAGGRLDVNVFVPTGMKLDKTALDAESAATNEGIARRLETFFGALEQHVGIDRGDVAFFAVDARLKFVDDETTLLDAFAASAGRPNAQALNLMLTNGIDFGDGGGAWGIAPGIPGAGVRTGTPMSGIVLAIGDTPAVGDGLTILHEAGHFFGLNHTTELVGGYADPLGDTPKCDAISLDDPLSLQACPDRKNVMFPAFYGTAGAAVAVSDAQRAVYRGSPIYKAYKEPLAAKTTMRHDASLGLRPGERITLTKSGRALSPVETWLSGSLCSHVKLDAGALGRAKRRPEIVAALEAAAVDPDLPAVMRTKAAGALRALAAGAPE